MTHYNPYQAIERHRRAKVRNGMTAGDVIRCMGITLAVVLLLWGAAMA